MAQVKVAPVAQNARKVVTERSAKNEGETPSTRVPTPANDNPPPQGQQPRSENTQPPVPPAANDNQPPETGTQADNNTSTEGELAQDTASTENENPDQDQNQNQPADDQKDQAATEGGVGGHVASPTQLAAPIGRRPTPEQPAVPTGTADIQNARREFSQRNRPEPIRNVRRSRQLGNANDNQPPATRRQQQGKPARNQLNGPLRKQAKQVKKTFKTSVRRAAVMVRLSPLLILYPAQFVMAVLSIVGYGVERAGEEFLWGIFSGAIPGETLFFTGLGIVIAVGVISMMSALILLWGGTRSFRFWAFAGCCLGYIVPVFNLVPWVFVYGWVVAGEKKNK